MTGTIKYAHLVVTIFMALILVGCGDEQGDDLDKFMAGAGDSMGKNVPPLPEVLPYNPVEFDADHTLFDPFQPRKVEGKGSKLQPDSARPREPLEAFPLELLKYVGSISKKNVSFALIKSPDNAVQQVKVGNYIGPNYGLITAINESDIEIKEVVQDDLTGDWVEHQATLSLQEE